MKKRPVAILTLVIICISLTLTPISAAPAYTSYAESLSALGVFLGTGNGFELERAPTRIECLVMLIRLLGAEKEAIAMNDEAIPFTDVPKWANGYAAYAYKNRLTNGISEKNFGSQMTADAKMYTTFLLRALGYNDNHGDFSYNSAVEFAHDIGLIDSSFNSTLNKDIFLRGHIAKMSYDALNFKYKNSTDSLIEVLMERGSIPKEIGKKFILGKVTTEKTPLTKSELSKNTRSLVEIATISDGDMHIGSGVIIDSDGIIYTTYHNIRRATEIVVVLDDGREFRNNVRVLGFDLDKNIAIIKIPVSGLIPAVLGTSNGISAGEEVMAISSPFGLLNTVTSGLISAVSDGYIQTSAPISEGSAGGALLNIYGEVIGIATDTITDGNNIGFAIPIDSFKNIKTDENYTLDQFYAYCLMNNTPRKPPQNLRIAYDFTDNVVGFQWDPVPGADYYHMYFLSSESDNLICIYDETKVNMMKFEYTDDFSVGIGTFKVGKSYAAFVTCVIDGIESKLSEPLVFTKKKAPELMVFYYDDAPSVIDFGRTFGQARFKAKDNVYEYRNVREESLAAYKRELVIAGFSRVSEADTDIGLTGDTYYDPKNNVTVVISETKKDTILNVTITIY